MFKNLRTSTKLILLCTAFITSVAVTTYSLVVEKQISIAFARKELTGSKFLADLRPIYVAVLTSAPFKLSPSASDASVHAAVEALATAQSKVPATLHISGFVEALSKSLIRLESASHVTKSADAMDALAKMQQLAARTGDSSNLTLDTDLDTYYVQNIVVNQMPKLLSLLGELAILPAQTSRSTTYSRENEVRFLVLDGLIKSAIDEIKDNLMAAYRGSPNDALHEAVGSTYGTLFFAVGTYVVGRREGIFGGDAAQANVKFEDSWEAVLDSTNRAWAVSQVQLDHLLQLRIDRLHSRMLLSLAMTGTFVALSIIIAIMTYRQIVRPLERLEKVATTVRDSKSYDVRVENTSTNEIGRVASAFDGMLAELAAARDRERYEQSELARVARLSTMGVMTASIAHEINQPLTAIVSSGNAALRWLSNAAPDLTEVDKLLRNIVESGHRASQIIYSVRAMFRKDEHEKEWIDANNVVKDILVLIQSKIRREAISVRTELYNDLPRVLASRTQLQQVLMNLIVNAIEAMSEVAGRDKLLVIKSEVSLPANVLISVKDTGTGIDPEKMDRIFEPFFTTKSDGMGMGLSICRSIIESYGGRLWASRGETCGSSFFINLPTAEIPGAAPSAHKAS